MATITVDIGDTVRDAVVFKDINDVETDPTTVKYKFKTAAGSTAIYIYGTDAEVVKDSTGNYHVDLPITAAGSDQVNKQRTWHTRWEGTGTIVAAAEGTITVRSSQFS